jgi:Domain of unknown function (DUF4537)/DNA repair protein Crb2 Tudor domain
MWKSGQRVFARKDNDQIWHTGTVRHVDGERCYVIFDDGDDALLVSANLAALELHAGDRIFARLPMDAEFKPAKVVAWDDEKVQVQWADGTQDWTSYGMIQLQPEARAELREGDRVFGCWNDDHWYPGVVLSPQEENQVHVLFDDGDQAILAPDKLRPLEVNVGDHVSCRYKGGLAYFPGEVTEKRGEVVHIRYDDGEEETTSIRLVRVQIDSNADLGRRFA